MNQIELDPQSPPEPVSQGWPGRTLRKYRDPQAYKAHLLSMTERHGDCLLFTGYISSAGYAMVSYRRRCRLAHHILWEIDRGEIPTGLFLDHTCHNPALCKLGKQCPHRRCINLNHIEAVTPKRNSSIVRSNAVASIGIALAAANALKKSSTHCPNGHEWSEENTRTIYIDGQYKQRVCKMCHRAKNAEYKRKKRASAKISRP